MDSKSFLEQTANSFERQIEKVIEEIDGLGDTAMQIAEAEDKWNMLQCIEHMTLTTKVYISNVNKILSSNPPTSSGKFKGSWKGRMFIKRSAPRVNNVIPHKLKTFKRLDPQGDLERQEVITEFITTHQRFIDLIKKSEAVDLDKTRVQTAIPIISLRLGDAFGFLLAHTQRHVVQLQRIKQVALSMGANQYF